MSFETVTMAVDARAAEARENAIVGRLEQEESALSLSGWRAGLAAAVLTAVALLLAAPVLAAAQPAMAAQAAASLGHLAGLNLVMLGVRALVFVVALVVITRPADHDATGYAG